MIPSAIELPRAAWISIIRWTALVSLGSVIISVLATNAILDILSKGINGPGLLAAISMPLLLGTPMMFYLTLSQQKLKYANQKLQELASTDWLTTCLNRRAFTAQVTGHLATATPVEGPLEGAFLVIDADHFKSINDHFGHDRGDEALRMMAAAIKTSVRDTDLVGRIGGEEFGVFLRGADFDTSERIAERIRAAIAAVSFTPAGATHPLSVSVGGAFFRGRIAFADLFRIADQRLYGAKQSGRNRVVLVNAAGPANAAAEAA
jgi:diguanylate cyclase